MTQPLPQPMDPAGWCAPHLVSGVFEHATTWVSGTSMCTAHAVANINAQSTQTGTTGTTGGTSTTGGLVVRL
ncbi:hypothetical protein [Klenkia brasiliensis]|uniref:Uncharacterized protein n=1 Tax=Klenkia brasiliensis TaxID=333142 RepID=A0A1G7YGF6_9ACTN|nr:hypothetical protein [Klenkia brasiliensis]SDG95638.1 hypothetical protein SAMN05660324_3951 [Klenkia brasiliensis]